MKKEFYILYVLLLSLIVYTFYQTHSTAIEHNSESTNQKNSLFCGTHIVSPELSEKATKGKRLFNMNCAACHKLDKHITGPALRNISEKYAANNLDLVKFLKGQRTELLYKEEFNQNDCMIFPQLTEEDIDHIISYLR